MLFPSIFFPPLRCIETLGGMSVCTTERTVWCDGDCRLGRDAYVPCSQSSIWVAAGELFALVVPGYWVDSLEEKRKHRERNKHRVAASLVYINFEGNNNSMLWCGWLVTFRKGYLLTSYFSKLLLHNQSETTKIYVLHIHWYFPIITLNWASTSSPNTNLSNEDQ